MLLLLNGAFFAVNALREPKTEGLTSAIDNDIPPLTLLSEKTSIIKLDIEKNTESSNEKPNSDQEKESTLDLKTWLARFTAKIPTVNDDTDKATTEKLEQSICYTAGPFQTTNSLQQATDYFSSINIQTQQRSIEENHYIGMLVYLPSQENRQQVIAIAESLAARGVKDYMLLNEQGKQHSLSLGVYGLKKNAEQRIKTLSKLNYHAKSEARYRKKTVYWLDYAFTASNNQSDDSKQHLSKLKVSQIERNCKS